LRFYQQEKNSKLVRRQEEKGILAHYRHEHTKYETNLDDEDYRNVLGRAGDDFSDPMELSHGLLKKDENYIARTLMEADGFYRGNEFLGLKLTCRMCGRPIDSSYKRCSNCKAYFCFECWTKQPSLGNKESPKCPTCKYKLTKVVMVRF